MDDDYFSLSSILADSHKLSCTFTLDVEGLGYLESGTENNIHEHAKVELPFWLAQTLSLNEFTTFSLPMPYSTRVRSALNASAQSVKLSHLVGGNGWWYRWGKRIAEVLDDEPQAELLGMLLKASLPETRDGVKPGTWWAFAGRLPALQDLSAHHASSDHSIPESGADTGEAFRDGMEGDERELFAIGQESGRVIKAWYDSNGGRKSILR